MKFWTIQHKSVFDILNQLGVYFPDFQKSYFVQKYPERTQLYNFLLKAFNENNKTDVPGLIFAYFYLEDNVVRSFDSYIQFKDKMTENSYTLSKLWNEFKERGDYYVVELEYSNLGNNFNPLFIDINDFQHLTPPILYNLIYTKDEVESIANNLRNGISLTSRYPSNIMQGHVPAISALFNVVDVYDFFDI